MCTCMTSSLYPPQFDDDGGGGGGGGGGRSAVFKARICSRLLTGIVDSNPAGVMDVYLLQVSCVVR